KPEDQSGTGALIFLDTNVISETLRKTPNPAVIAWLVRNDAELALPTVTIAEIAFGIGKIRPDQRAARLEQGLAAWRHRFADRIFPFTESSVRGQRRDEDNTAAVVQDRKQLLDEKEGRANVDGEEVVEVPDRGVLN